MNCNTQNANIKSITEKTLIIGIDIGSETHYARAFDWRNYEYSKKPFSFNNDEDGFETFRSWMNEIAEKHGKDTVIPGMEPTGHYWLNLGAYLQEQGMKPVHVNPHHVKKSKELDDNSPNKNDRKNPKAIAGLVNKEDFHAHIFRQQSMQRSEVCQIFVFRHRKRYQGYEAAISVIGKNPEFKSIHEYYLTRKKNPLKRMQSVIAIACKLIRVFYMILTKGVDYDGRKMLKDIVRPEIVLAA